MMKRNDGFVNEVYAFHKLRVGAEKLEAIFENNLDKEYSIRSDTFNNNLGDGIYFHIDPSLIVDKENPRSGKFVYVKLLAGYWTKECDPKCSLPPKRLPNILFDSTVDDIENTICIFDKNQCMPLYLIEFYQ